jgi:NitT/TauT family transport system permease protein
MNFDRLNRILPPLLLIAAVVALWWFVVVQSESLIFPTPAQVASGTVELAADGTLWRHIGASLLRVATGFLIAMLVALPLGLWMGRVDAAYRTFNPLFQILRPISPIAWIPIAILWFGVGDVSPVFLIFLAAVFPMIVQTAAGVHAIDGRYLRAAENFGVPRARLFRQVIVPAVLPEVLTGMRISLGVAWLVVVAAEMIVRSSGLGFLIMDARNAGNRYDLVVAAMIIIGLIGLGIDVAMRQLEGIRQVRWRYGR